MTQLRHAQPGQLVKVFRPLVLRKDVTTMRYARLALSILFCVGAISCYGQASGTQADNTGVNKRDRNAGEVTADQQKVDKADRDMTKRIRRSIMADKSLSSLCPRHQDRQPGTGL